MHIFKPHLLPKVSPMKSDTDYFILLNVLPIESGLFCLIANSRLIETAFATPFQLAFGRVSASPPQRRHNLMFFLLPLPHSIHLPPTSGPLPRRQPSRFSDAVKWALSIIQDLPLCCCRRGCCLWCHRSCWWLHFLHCNEPGPATYLPLPPRQRTTLPRCSGSFVKAEAAHYPPCLCCHCSCCRRTHDAGWWENARLVWHFHYRCGICAFLWQTFDPGLHRPTAAVREPPGDPPTRRFVGLWQQRAQIRLQNY